MRGRVAFRRQSAAHDQITERKYIVAWSRYLPAYPAPAIRPRCRLHQPPDQPETIPGKSRLGLCYPPRVSSTSSPVQSIRRQSTPRHTALVRVTHWITVISFFALLITGAEIVISHPRFYWGETGNSGTPALFTIPIPASRDTVPTGYSYVMPDQNGWSRYLHFEAAWVLVLTGLVYAVAGLLTAPLPEQPVPPAWRSKVARLPRSVRQISAPRAAR